MVPLFPVLRRFARAVVSAWRSDETFRVLVVLTVCLLASGTTFYSIVEKWSVVDALYFSVVTLTTVGLGDFAPTTALAKLFTVLYIFVGLGIIGAFINILAKHTFTVGEEYVRQAEEWRGDGEGQEGAPRS